MKEWSVYLVECNDGSYYCGITLNVEKRVKKHNEGKGGKYTRSHRPVKLLDSCSGLTHGEALRFEACVKGYPRKAKLQAIATFEQNKDYYKEESCETS